MRASLVLIGLVLIGCGSNKVKGADANTANSSQTSAEASRKASADPVSDLYAQMKAASIQIDACAEDLGDAMATAKKLAPKAGGDARVALLDVADKLNSAGQSVSDYATLPPSIEQFRKEFADQDEKRLSCIDDSVSALKDLYKADDVLQDLAQNVPDEYKSSLNSINDKTGDAIDALETAVKGLGGKIPDLSDEPSQN